MRNEGSKARASGERGNWTRRFSLGRLGWLLCVTLLLGAAVPAAVSGDGNNSASLLATLGAGTRVVLDEGARFARDLQIIYQGIYLRPLVVEAAASPAAAPAACKSVSMHEETAAPKSAKSRS